MQNIGENVILSVGDNSIKLEIDTTHRGSRSASGKTIRVASTMGNQKINLPDGTTIWIGLNIYTK